jgi:serine/threonine protein kinase
LDGKCSPAFAATEVLLDPSLLAGPEVDVFALGLILVQLRRGFRQVFASDSAARDMAQREREIALALGQLQSDELRDLLRAMLHADPKQRLTMGQVMKNQLIAAGHVTLAQNANMAKEINSLGKKVDEAIALMKALSGSLSSFRQEALEGIASVRTNTAEGARAMADLKEELCAGEERLEAVSRASAQELRRALLDETWALARSLK